MARTQGAHNSGEIIIWVGNNYCPKADIFGRQSLAIKSKDAKKKIMPDLRLSDHSPGCSKF